MKYSKPRFIITPSYAQQKDGQAYLKTLQSIKEDDESWKNCGPCAQNENKKIEYCECGECDHLSVELLRNICLSNMATQAEMARNGEMLYGKASW